MEVVVVKGGKAALMPCVQRPAAENNTGCREYRYLGPMEVRTYVVMLFWAVVTLKDGWK